MMKANNPSENSRERGLTMDVHIEEGHKLTAEDLVNSLKCNKPSCSCGKPSGGGWMTHCPAHDDEHPSLSLSESGDGKVLFNCHAGCSQERVIDALKERGLWGKKSPNNKGKSSQAQVGLTLEELAEAKQLPLDFLQGLGLTDYRSNKRDAVKIPYVDPSGETEGIRFRLSLNGAQRFAWRKDDKTLPYGLWLLRDLRKAGWVLLVEGESDCWTAWHHGLPALGIPGKSTWKSSWAEYLTDLETFLWQEPDAPELGAKLAVDIPDLKIIQPPEGIKDLSEAHLQGQDILKLIEELKAQATTVKAIEQADLEAEIKELSQQAAALLECPNLLEEVVKVLRLVGLAGQEREAKILYLALTSRVMERPINIVVKGQSSGGKSHLVQTVLRLFPESAYYDLSAMSERALIYDEEPISHRFLIIYEAAGLGGELAQYIIRSLLSEGQVRYVTTEKTDQGLRPRQIERRGPTGFITTTTKISLHPENETRMLSLEVNDTPEQTRDVLLAHARGRGRAQPDLSAFLALQSLIDLDHLEVDIPYGEVLAQMCNPSAVRIRRDFPTVLTLINTHALLHTSHREKDEQGRVIATLKDYDVVYHLVAELLAYGTGQRVSTQVRATVDAVRELTNGNPDHDGIKVRELAEKMEVSPSTASRRVWQALKLGYLINKEILRGRPYRLVCGDPLPEDGEVLPHPDLVKKGGEGTPPESGASVQVSTDCQGESVSYLLHSPCKSPATPAGDQQASPVDQGASPNIDPETEGGAESDWREMTI